jgi:hypothetical protein
MRRLGVDPWPLGGTGALSLIHACQATVNVVDVTAKTKSSYSVCVHSYWTHLVPLQRQGTINGLSAGALCCCRLRMNLAPARLLMLCHQR